MKLSRKFLSDYVEVPVDIKTLAEEMTGLGNEYDSCGKLLPVNNLIIGEVLSCVAHPDSDHLHLCKVNIGTETLQIICGAPNVREGLKVIVALVGAELPGGTIKKGNIRGEESNGMLCALGELGLDHKFLKEKDVEGIHELPADAPVGEDPVQYLQLDDEVIDFDLTSNRGDLLSIIGMAYEVGALYDHKVTQPDTSFHETEGTFTKDFHLEVETDACPLFLARKVTNVTIKESPEFIKNRLMASGIRPINNVVDISNYVMLETGQPLHYYDATRLGNKLIVRMASEQETLTTLDKQERTLSPSDIVIASDTGAVGLAGVMGGLTTEIEEDTKDILIESAIFQATAVRKTSKKVLRSEASSRFEKGLDPRRTYLAMLRSCHLLEKYADATVMSGMVEHKTLTIEDKEIIVSYEKINQVLGIVIPQEQVISIFQRLDFQVEDQEKQIKVIVPTRRTDISIPEDLIEEVGRIYGIDNIQGKTMILPVIPGHRNENNRMIRNKLASLGLNEIHSYSLISEKEVYKYTGDKFDYVKIADPMTEERNTLRYSLISSLMNIYAYNKARNKKDICLYEVGHGFSKLEDGYHEENKLAVLMSGEYELGLHPTKVDFYVIKGVLEELLEYLGYQGRYSLRVTTPVAELHPGQSATIILNNVVIGIIGKVHPMVSKDDIYVFEMNLDTLFSFRVKGMQYKELSKYPSVVKDLAFITKKSLVQEELVTAMKKAGGKLLTGIELFDFYEGENVGADEKSLAYSLTFQDPSRTLNEEEVMEVFHKIIEAVEKSNLGTLRNQ